MVPDPTKILESGFATLVAKWPDTKPDMKARNVLGVQRNHEKELTNIIKIIVIKKFDRKNLSLFFATFTFIAYGMCRNNTVTNSHVL